jgi:hypothetical protein
MSKSSVFIGIDVAVRPTGDWQVANDEAAYGDLVDRLRILGPTLIVLEGTGNPTASCWSSRGRRVAGGGDEPAPGPRRC